MSPRVVSIAPKKRRRELFVVTFDDGEPIELRVETAARVHSGDEFSEAQIETLLREDEVIRCREAAWRLLSLRLRSRQELFRALRQRKYLAATIDPILDDLEKKGFLNDEVFAAQFAQEKHRQHKGPRLIKQQLQARGITREAAAEATEPIATRESQDESARALLTKWNRRSKPEDPQKRRQAAAGFLMRRGFDSGVVWEAVREILGDGHEQED